VGESKLSDRLWLSFSLAMAKPNKIKYFDFKCKWDDSTLAYNLQPYFVPTCRNKSKIFGHMTAYSQSTQINWL
jgi:hypothetical protein